MTMLYLWLIPLIILGIIFLAAVMFRGRHATTSRPNENQETEAMKRDEHLNR